MELVQQAEVNFHEQEQLSVFLESNSTGALERASEIGLFTMFSLRMLSNLDVCEASDNLARFLLIVPATIKQIATGEATGGFQLVPFPGYAGHKQFVLRFHLTDARLKFDLAANGFGPLAEGVGYYGPVAVLGVLRELAIKRREDRSFLEHVASAAALTGRAHLERRITLTNQSELGSTFLHLCAGDYFPLPPSTSDDTEAKSVSEGFDARLCEALGFIVDRLARVQEQFGPQDFPRDDGVSFRNEFIEFALNFINEVQYRDSAEDDYWFIVNPQLLEVLTPRQLVQVIGVLHFYAATCDVCRGRTQAIEFRKMLDWILNAYECSEVATAGWFEVAEANTEKYSVPLGERKMYAEIASIIGADPMDMENERAWCGMGFVVRHGHECDEVAHAKWCAQAFA